MTSLTQKTSKARHLYEKWKALRKIKENISWDDAEILYAWKTERLYKYVFGTDDLHEDVEKSWRSFVGEIDEPLSTVDFKVSLYKKWIVELGYTPQDLAGIHTRKLHRAIPYVTKKNVEDILSQAKALSFSSFLAYLKGEEDHIHEKVVSSEKVVKCKVCKKKLK